MAWAGAAQNRTAAAPFNNKGQERHQETCPGRHRQRTIRKRALNGTSTWSNATTARAGQNFLKGRTSYNLKPTTSLLDLKKLISSRWLSKTKSPRRRKLFNTHVLPELWSNGVSLMILIIVHKQSLFTVIAASSYWFWLILSFKCLTSSSVAMLSGI